LKTAAVLVGFDEFPLATVLRMNNLPFGWRSIRGARGSVAPAEMLVKQVRREASRNATGISRRGEGMWFLRVILT
jgi:hypothetical protein